MRRQLNATKAHLVREVNERERLADENAALKQLLQGPGKSTPKGPSRSYGHVKDVAAAATARSAEVSEAAFYASSAFRVALTQLAIALHHHRPLDTTTAGAAVERHIEADGSTTVGDDRVSDADDRSDPSAAAATNPETLFITTEQNPLFVEASHTYSRLLVSLNTLNATAKEVAAASASGRTAADILSGSTSTTGGSTSTTGGSTSTTGGSTSTTG
eukprot:Lankesteria_metandrocarpae@DN7406_c0_g1_i1.p1